MPIDRVMNDGRSPDGVGLREPNLHGHLVLSILFSMLTYLYRYCTESITIKSVNSLDGINVFNAINGINGIDGINARRKIIVRDR